MATVTTHNHDFERQRELLISEIAESLGRCITAVNQLNRNIESVTSVGANFTPVTMLWKQFENVMIDSNAAPEEVKEPILAPASAAEVHVAPGGGETVTLGEAEHAMSTPKAASTKHA